MCLKNAYLKNFNIKYQYKIFYLSISVNGYVILRRINILTVLFYNNLLLSLFVIES